MPEPGRDLAMGHDRAFPARFAIINPRFRSPGLPSENVLTGTILLLGVFVLGVFLLLGVVLMLAMLTRHPALSGGESRRSDTSTDTAPLPAQPEI